MRTTRSARTLLTAELGDVQQLAWLGQTSLKLGLFGPVGWGGNGDHSALVVAGSYARDSRGGLPAALGNRYTATLFPPEQQLPAPVRDTGAEIAIVLPIKTMNAAIGACWPWLGRSSICAHPATTMR